MTDPGYCPRSGVLSMTAGVLTASLLALAGCATSAVNAQWSDPQFAGQPLRGAKVLVACQAVDMTLRRVCADRSAAKLSALGAIPLLAPDGGDAAPVDSAALLQAARDAGAVAVLNTTVAPEVAVASPGPSFGIGIGGFGGGGYRSGGGVGFGVSAPIGGCGLGGHRLRRQCLADRRGQRPPHVERARHGAAVVGCRPATDDAGDDPSRFGASGGLLPGLSLRLPRRR